MTGTKPRQVHSAPGTVEFRNANVLANEAGAIVVMGRYMSLAIIDENGEERTAHKLGYGTTLHVTDGGKVGRGDKLFEWDPYTLPIIAEADGKARFVDLYAGISVRDETDDATGMTQKIVTDWRSAPKGNELKPEVILVGADGEPVRNEAGNPLTYAMSVDAILSIEDDFDRLTGEPTYRIDGDVKPARDFIHLRSPFGRSPLTLYRDAIGTAAALDRHAARLFGRGARPSGVLKFPKGMGEESVKKARAAWRATHEGEDTGGRTAILYDGAEFEALTLASTDAQFMENRAFQVLEVARAFRVPPTMLFHLDRATWSNTEQLGQEFLSYCLEPWLRATEGALRRALFPGDEASDHVVRFDWDDLTRADLGTRSTVINSLIASRVMNPNEGRAWLGMAPYAGGDGFANPNITPDPTPGPDATEDAPDDAAQ